MTQYTVNQVPTTCTAVHITGWIHPRKDLLGRMVEVNTFAHRMWLYFKCKEFDLVAKRAKDPYRNRHEYWLDMAYVFVTIPHDQVIQGAGDVLNTFGFEDVYKADKDRAESREQNHGALHMFIANPGDLEDKVKGYIRSFEAEWKKAFPLDRAEAARRKELPDMTWGDAVSRSLVSREAHRTHTVGWVAGAVKVANQDFRNKWIEIYGIDCQKVRNISFDQAYENQKNWKRGLPNYCEG